MSIYTEAREKITGLNNDQWQEVSDKVTTHPEYGFAQTEKNLKLILDALSISLPEDANTLREMLDNKEFERFAANKLFALVTDQPQWFANLQNGIDDPGVAKEPDMFQVVRQRVEQHLTGKFN